MNDLLSGATTSGGITLSATGFPDGSFNVTASGFGLNNAGSDDTDEFDPGQGFTFTFDTGVELNSLKVSQFGSGTSNATVSFDGGATIASVTGTGITSLSDTYVSSGTVLRFESDGSTPFSLDNIVVTSAVPEPTSFTALLGLSSLALVATRRRRQKPSPMLAA